MPRKLRCRTVPPPPAASGISTIALFVVVDLEVVKAPVPLVRAPIRYAHVVLRVAVLSGLVTLFALPLSAATQEFTGQTTVNGPLLRSGMVVVARMSSRSSEPVHALQAQQPALNNRKTVVVVIAIAAVVALVLIPYTQSHAHGPILIVSQ